MVSFKYVVIVGLSLSFLMPVPAQAERTKGYFEQNSGAETVAPRKGGYFFYKDPILEPPVKKLPPPKSLQSKTVPPAEEKPKKTPYNGVMPWDKVQSMHPDEFQTLMTDSLNYALVNPNEEKRMLDYITLQMVAIQRAENFQQQWGKVLTKYPALDPTASRPVSKVASIAITQTDSQESNEAIMAMRENMGILIFTRADCGYCKQQSEIMKRFQEWWGWENYDEVDIAQYPQIAAEYGVDIVPDIYLVANFNGEIVSKRLKTGLTTREELQQALLHAYYNWYKGKDYKTPMIEQGDAAFATHLERVKEEQNSSSQKPTINEDEFKRRVLQQK